MRYQDNALLSLVSFFFKLSASPEEVSSSICPASLAVSDTSSAKSDMTMSSSCTQNHDQLSGTELTNLRAKRLNQELHSESPKPS